MLKASNATFCGDGQKDDLVRITHMSRHFDELTKLIFVNRITGDTVIFDHKKPKIDGFYEIIGKPKPDYNLGRKYSIDIPPTVQALESTILCVDLWYLYPNWESIQNTFPENTDIRTVKTIVEHLSPGIFEILNAFPSDQISAGCDSSIDTCTESLKSRIRNHGSLKCWKIC